MKNKFYKHYWMNLQMVMVGLSLAAFLLLAALCYWVFEDDAYTAIGLLKLIFLGIILPWLMGFTAASYDAFQTVIINSEGIERWFFI